MDLYIKIHDCTYMDINYIRKMKLATTFHNTDREYKHQVIKTVWPSQEGYNPRMAYMYQVYLS